MGKARINQPIQWTMQADTARIKRQLQHENITRSYNQILDERLDEFVEMNEFRTKREAIIKEAKHHLPELFNDMEHIEIVEHVGRKLLDVYQISAPLQEFNVVFDRWKPENEDPFDWGMRSMDFFIALEEHNLLTLKVHDHDKLSSVYVNSKLKLTAEDMERMDETITNSPMFCEPLNWDDKGKMGGYLRRDTKILMGNPKQHHEKKIPTEATNILQQIKWFIDWDVYHALIAMGYQAEDGVKQEMEKMIKLFKNSPMWFTWGLDLRYRSYLRAYGLNPNGSQFQKGIMTFGKLKIISDKSIRRLKIDIAGRLGYDDLNEDDRLSWFEQHVEPTLDGVASIGGAARRIAFKNLIAVAAKEEESFAVAVRQISEYLKARRGEPCRAKTYRDATANGIQLLSQSTNDGGGMMISNVIPNADNNRMDAYKVGADDMSVAAARVITRKDFKDPGMTVLYGSQEEPKKAFGKDVKYFYNTMNKIVPGAMLALNTLRDSWQAGQDHHTWNLFDDRTIYIPNLVSTTEIIDMEIDGEPTLLELTKYEIEGQKQGVSLAANVTHSYDAVVKDEIIIEMHDKYGAEVHTNHDEFVCDIEWDEELLQAGKNGMLKLYTYEKDGRYLLEDTVYQITGKSYNLQLEEKDYRRQIRKSKYIIC